MYYAHFGLSQPPFKITPNTEFFFSGGNRGAVLDALLYAIGNGEGIVKVVGEVGSGKTMLCRMLQARLPENVESVYLAIPSVEPEHVLHAIAFELQLKLPKNADRLKAMQVLQSYLLKRHVEGKHVVVFVEEAQGMPLATLEEIRLLSNLETKHDKLLQIVLFGQPELDRNLNETGIRQLRDRITHSFNLGPLEESEVKEYLIFRLRAAGYYGPHLFSDAAIKKITQAAEGLVRRINILADKALLATFAENTYQVRPKHVIAAIKDSEFAAEYFRKQSQQWLKLIFIFVLMMIALTVYGLYQWHKAGDLPLMPSQPEKNLQSMTEMNIQASPEKNEQLPPSQVISDLAKIDLNTLLERRIAMTEHWLKQQPHSRVTIQILGGTDDRQIENELTALAQKIELDHIYAFRTIVNHQPFVNLLYGDFSNREEAVLAMQKLPANLQLKRPQLRTVGGILQEKAFNQ